MAKKIIKKKAPAKKPAAKKKIVEKPEMAQPSSAPSFLDLAVAAAQSDYARLQSEILNEIKTVKKPKTVSCSKCKKKAVREEVVSYFCPSCEGVTYFDDSSGLQIRLDAGYFLNPDQISRLTVARIRVASLKSAVPVAQ